MFSLLALVTLVAIGSGERISCTPKKTKYCYEVHGVDIFNTYQGNPAPMAEQVTATPSSDGSINVEWSQRKFQLTDVQAYSLQVASGSFDGLPSYAFAINSSLILNTFNGSDNLVRFTFKFKVGGVPLSFLLPATVTLYSLPLYRENDRDYYQKVNIGAKQQKKDPPPLLPIVPDRPDDLELATIRQESTTAIRQESTTAIRQESTQATEICSCKLVLIVSVMTTNFMTVSITIICVLSWKKYRKGKKKATQVGTNGLLTNTKETGNASDESSRTVLVLTSSDEDDDIGPSRDYFKKIALCLANTLQSSQEFRVSCNLWMNEDISEKGVAVWAHDVMKNNSKVIILCNSDEMRKTSHYSDSYSQLIRNMIKMTYYDKSKFLIVCMDETASHVCFTKMDEILESCRRFKIRRNINDLLHELQPGLDRKKLERMNQIFAQTMTKLHLSPNNRTHRQDIKTPCPLHEVIYENDSISEQLIATDKAVYFKHREFYSKNRRRNISEASTSDGKIETQYDSLYSSRCNSQSSEALSSGDDTSGYLDQSQKCVQSCANQVQNGARAKVLELERV